MDEKNKPENFPEEEQPSALSDMLGALGFKPKAQRPGKQEDIRNKPERESVPDGESPLEQEVKAPDGGNERSRNYHSNIQMWNQRRFPSMKNCPFPRKRGVGYFL